MSKQSSDNSIYGTGRSGILWYFLEGSKKFFLLSILCSIVTSFLDLISPRLVGVTVDLITGEFHEDSSAVLRALLAKLGGASYVREHLAVIAFVVILLALLGALFRYWYQVLNSMGAETLVERMRNSLFSHLERIRFSWYGENRTGDLIQRCTSDVETVKEFLSEQLTSVFRIILLIILSLYFMFRLNPKLAVLSAVFVPVIFLYSMMFFRKIGETFLVADEEEGNLSSIAQENLTGVRVVRAFGRERMEREKFRAQNDIYTKAYMKLSILISFFWSAGDFISGTQVMLVVVLGAVQVVRGHMTAGDYIAFISYNAMLTWPVRSLGRVVSQMSRAGVSVDRIRYIMDAPEESADGTQPEDDLPMDIQFHHVTFSYIEGREKLKDISLSIPAGTTFGILGSPCPFPQERPSGSWAGPAPANPLWWLCWTASMSFPGKTAPLPSAVRTSGIFPCPGFVGIWESSCRNPICSPVPSGKTSLWVRSIPPRKIWPVPAASPVWMRPSKNSRKAWTPWWVNGASLCPAVRNSVPPSPSR